MGNARVVANQAQLRPKFNHETDPTMVREYPAFWDTLRKQDDAFRSDAAAWNVWYLLGFDEVREAFQRSDLLSSHIVIPFAEEKEQMPWIPLTLDPPEHQKPTRILYRRFCRPSAQKSGGWHAA